MADRFTESSREGYFSRIGNALGGVVIGFVLFAGSIFLLGWNEGRAVHRAKALQEGAGAVISVESSAINPQKEGKLVHFSGEASGEKLGDPVVGVTPVAIRMKRDVRMYQWKETESSSTRKDTIGGGTTTEKTYSYEKTWSDKLLNSSEFKHPEGHANPSEMEVSTQEWTASQSKVGAFILTPGLVSEINNFTPVTLTQENIAHWSDNLRSRAKLTGQEIYLSGSKNESTDTTSPQVGDLKIAVTVALPTVVSVIGRQSGSTLDSYPTRDGRGLAAMLHMGTHSAADMFKAEAASNANLTWILRALGFFFMFVSINLVLAPIKVMSDLVGIFGSIVGVGVGLVALLSAAIISLLTIAIAWVVYRPVVGIALIAVAVGVIVVLKKSLDKRRAGAGAQVGAAV